jgi:hypothetical protein
MIIRGYRKNDTPLYLLPMRIYMPEINKSMPISFLIDTGSDTTIICGAYAFSLDLTNLSPRTNLSSVSANAGTSDLIPLYNCRLDYEFEPKYSKTLDLIGILRPSSGDIRDVIESENILGMDFLEDFTISFKNDIATLEI